MIKLKISMNDGRAFKIRNLEANSVHDFIKFSLMPAAVELIWYEILPTQFIRVSNISLIEMIPGEFEEPLEEPEKEKTEEGESDEKPEDSD